jgi:hypothetical protein
MRGAKALFQRCHPVPWLGGLPIAPLSELQELPSIFEGILMQIREETASNFHASAFLISLPPQPL